MSPFLSLADSESMNLYDIDLVTIEGKPQKMDDYRSKTLLIVNVASQCGFTPRYEGLQALYANSRKMCQEPFPALHRYWHFNFPYSALQQGS
jgi:hypothetical protein